MTIILPFRRVEPLENTADSCIVRSMNDEPEEWRQIADFPSYSVSNLGNVRRDKAGLSHMGVVGPCLSQEKMARNYRRVTLWQDGKMGRFSVHSLVALYFIGPRPEGYQICHNNGNPSDNRADNLRYGTAKENVADKHVHGTFIRGEQHVNSKLNDETATEMRRMRRCGDTLECIAQRFGVKIWTVHDCVSGASWNHVAESAVVTGPRKGANHPFSKLTEDDIRGIRAAVARGESQSSLVKRYGVGAMSISNIVNRKSWKHVA